jgi:cell wall-associated NlpC family hydrolase
MHLTTDAARRLLRRLPRRLLVAPAAARRLWQRLPGSRGVARRLPEATGFARRLRRRLPAATGFTLRLLRRLSESGFLRRSPETGLLIPILVSVLAMGGIAAGVVLAATGGQPVGRAWQPPLVPTTRPAPPDSASPVLPLLGRNVGLGRAVAVASATPTAPAPAAGAGTPAPPSVAPLGELRQPDLLVVAPFSLSTQVQTAVSRLPGVTGTDPVEAAKVQINGAYTAVLGVDPSTFREYAAKPTAASDGLWQGVAAGGIAVSWTMGTDDRLPLGGGVTVTGTQSERLPVIAFGTVGIGGVDAVVSDSVARSLGMPAGNAIVVSAPPARVAALAILIQRVLPPGAGVESLVTLVTEPTAAGTGPPPNAGADGGPMTVAELDTALRSAESRRGLPYVWGGAGPSTFDCSGLVQWAFAQAGVRMPRVADDQARAGPAVPVSELEPGDLLFYHTDPTAPGYISHVAIYLGNGWMIQAPEPGLDVQIVPASFGSEFAGAIRVYPQIAATAAASLA